jgi:carbonic anhydrase
MEILCLCGHADCGAATIEPGAAHEFAARPDAITPRTPPFRP